MHPEIIRKVQSYGFDVYMRRPSDTYLFFTDGSRLGYLEFRRMEGFTLSTVHIPNRGSGTGFQVARHVGSFDKALLLECFDHFPSWVARQKIPRPAPWPSVETWLNANSWNRGYSVIPAIQTAGAEE